MEKEIICALIKAQTQIETVKRSSKNPYFKSTFADLNEILAAVKKPLADNGLGFAQSVTMTKIDNDFLLKTILFHTSGQTLEFYYPIFFSKKLDKDDRIDAQGFGGGVTYAKRYALQALFGIATEDDDGETAVGRGKQNQEISLEEKILSDIAADKSLTEKIRKLRMSKKEVLQAFAEFKSLERFDEVLSNEIDVQEARKKESLDNL